MRLHFLQHIRSNILTLTTLGSSNPDPNSGELNPTQTGNTALDAIVALVTTPNLEFYFS